MNKYQRLVITVAIIDLIVFLLFPPFLERSLVRNSLPSFDGFYFLLAEIGRRPIDTTLLSLEIFWVIANTLAAWLILEKSKNEETRDTSHAIGIGLFAFVNLSIIGLFPPFEQYNSLFRTTAPGFDSFYFLFGNRTARPFFLPLLQLEIFFVLINALALYLLFNAVQRSERIEKSENGDTADARIPNAERLRTVNKSPEQRAEAERRRIELAATLGRKEDRRHRADPHYRGRERRTGHDRRHLPE